MDFKEENKKLDKQLIKTLAMLIPIGIVLMLIIAELLFKIIEKM